MAQPTQVSLDEIIRSIAWNEVLKLKVWCRGCHRLKDKEDVSISGCKCCFQGIMAYCTKCGGKERAQKAVVGHVRWHASELAVNTYGTAHRAIWRLYKEKLIKRVDKTLRKAA